MSLILFILFGSTYFIIPIVLNYHYVMVLVMDDEESNTVERFDDVVLPGFRFHPTDEELVSFYLKRKVLHKSLPFELIKKVDIYKYDPWDLPSKPH